MGDEGNAVGSVTWPTALLFEPNSSARTSNAKGTSIPHNRLLLASLASSTGDVAPAEVLSSLGIRVKADLAQLRAKFVALVVLIKLKEGIEGGTRHAINRPCEPIKDCGRFQIPLVVGMFDGFLSAKLGLPLEYLNEDYAPLAVMFVEFFSVEPQKHGSSRAPHIRLAERQERVHRRNPGSAEDRQWHARVC